MVLRSANWRARRACSMLVKMVLREASQEDWCRDCSSMDSIWHPRKKKQTWVCCKYTSGNIPPWSCPPSHSAPTTQPSPKAVAYFAAPMEVVNRLQNTCHASWEAAVGGHPDSPLPHCLLAQQTPAEATGRNLVFRGLCTVDWMWRVPLAPGILAESHANPIQPHPIRSNCTL